MYLTLYKNLDRFSASSRTFSDAAAPLALTVACLILLANNVWTQVACLVNVYRIGTSSVATGCWGR